MGLKNKAIAEYKKHGPITMESQLAAANKAFQRCIEWFGQIPDRVEIGVPTILPFVECDGIRLHYCDRDDAFRLKYPCPVCGTMRYSPSFRTLYELGKYLSSFTPHPHPYCEGILGQAVNLTNP